MKTVTLTKGLPGSGKSTWAKQMVSEHPNSYKRVNKDELRAMLDDGNFSRSSEKFIIKLRDSIILLALEEGKHVIVDDTNLDEKHFKHIKELVKGKASVEYKFFTDVPLNVCIENDLKRLNSVGKDVIMKMYETHLKPKPNPIKKIDGLDNVILCDLDGTLCKLNGRNPYDASTCDQDELNVVVASLLKDRDVILVSAREDKFMEPTKIFLDKHNIKYRDLLMRKTGDMRKDSIIKREIFEEKIRNKYNVDFILDDRNQVVEMWRSIGLTCLQVADGNF